MIFDDEKERFEAFIEMVSSEPENLVLIEMKKKGGGRAVIMCKWGPNQEGTIDVFPLVELLSKEGIHAYETPEGAERISAQDENTH